MGAACDGPAAAAAAANEEVEEVEEEARVKEKEVEEGEDDLDPWGVPWRPTPAGSPLALPTAA